MDGVRLKENWKIIEPKIKYDKQDTITNKILGIRGIENKNKFLNPSDDDINNPFLLSNMKEAVEKIVNAINNNLSIGIYADIDTDGVTSATIMYKYLKHYDINPTILYHQRNKNHGVIISNVPKDLDLLIIVDSSSNSAKECSVLSKNMDIIVLDHHDFERKNPYAIIVNPQYNDYPNKFLSGAGVVYQTCRAIDEEMLQFYADNYIDICAVGLIGDVMNVISPETRALIYKGLLKIHNNCDKNILAILKNLKKEYKPNATTIGFYLVPFINAIIRLGKIEDVLEILTTDDEKRLKELIKSCSGMNDKRKTLQSDIADKIDNIIDLTHKIIIVDVTELDSPKTLNGLIANTIAQKYQKPTIVVSLDTDTNLLNGSGRNYGNEFDFKEILVQIGLFESVGGHSGAFGVEFKPENLNLILNKVDTELEHLKQEYVIEADMIIDIKDITWDLLNEIQRLSFITGEGFKEPMFIIENLPVGDVKTMKEVHLKFNAEELECVKFNVASDEIEEVENAICVDVLGSLSINSWYNFGTKETIRTKQVMIKDLVTY
jgi:single-stranded-DNA-specific exonuclease